MPDLDRSATPPHPQPTPAPRPAEAPGGDVGDPCAVPALAALCACHERFDDVLDMLRDLAPHLKREGPDERARRAAARVLAFLDFEAPGHRAVVEREVLPVLRRVGGAAGVALAARLEAEQGLLARAWSQCRPALADLAETGRWSRESAAFEFDRWRDFSALAMAHLLAEHGAAFPAVAAHLK
ncbi:MAG: hemerythrin domain-containing protein [Burkholderiales bacterium]|nr:hemerythrin domain-containing protein [Burkholderiales bacterium]